MSIKASNDLIELLFIHGYESVNSEILDEFFDKIEGKSLDLIYLYEEKRIDSVEPLLQKYDDVISEMCDDRCYDEDFDFDDINKRLKLLISYDKRKKSGNISFNKINK